jgi:hypothetical protein
MLSILFSNDVFSDLYIFFEDPSLMSFNGKHKAAKYPVFLLLYVSAFL